MFHESLWVYFIGSISFLNAMTMLMHQVNFSSQIRLVLSPGELFLLFRRKHHKVRASDSECIENSGLNAASHFHVSCVVFP